ncbi:MAG: hypothetical protein ACRDVN_09455, partial [Jiangellaceae bacterium]
LPGRVQGGAHAARTVAGFAAQVTEAARDGDEVALAIWAAAAGDLADTLSTACDHLPEDDQRVAFTGSLFELDDLVTEPLRRLVAARRPRAVLRRAAGDPLVGASRLAYGPAGVYESLLLRRPASEPVAFGHRGLGSQVLPEVKED